LTSYRRAKDLDTGLIVDDHICAIALCSDGVIEAMLGARNAHDGRLYYYAPPEFRSYFGHFADSPAGNGDLEHKLASADFAQTSPDDKTIVMAVRQKSAAPLAPTSERNEHHGAISAAQQPAH
jgi:hypothetical protein